MQHDTSPLHGVDQAVDCGLWNAVPLLFNGCAKILDIGGNWNTLSYTSIQTGSHVRWMDYLSKEKMLTNRDVNEFVNLREIGFCAYGRFLRSFI